MSFARLLPFSPSFHQPTAIDPAPGRRPGQNGRYTGQENPLWFTLDGRPFKGAEGDSILTALMACGRSGPAGSALFRTQTGVQRLAGDDPCGWVHVEGRGLCHAATTPLLPGMVLHGVKPGSLPRNPQSEALAIGAPVPDHLRLEKTGLAILGSGSAGLAATRLACKLLVDNAHPDKSATRITLVDQAPRPGQELFWYRGGLPEAEQALRDQLLALRDQPRLQALQGCQLLKVSPDGEMLLRRSDGSLMRLQARAILWTGTEEEAPLALPALAEKGGAGKDGPRKDGRMAGIVSLDSLFQLSALYNIAPSPGQKVVLLASRDSAIVEAMALENHGFRLSAIIDSRLIGAPADPEALQALECLKARDVLYLPCHSLYRIGRRAGGTVGHVIPGRILPEAGSATGEKARVSPVARRFDTDLVCFAGPRRAPATPVGLSDCHIPVETVITALESAREDIAADAETACRALMQRAGLIPGAEKDNVAAENQPAIEGEPAQPRRKGLFRRWLSQNRAG